MTTASTSITPKDLIRTAAAVLRAALVASCLRGALPRYDKSEFTYKEISVAAIVAHLQSTCGRFAGDNDEISQWSEWQVFDLFYLGTSHVFLPEKLAKIRCSWWGV